MTGCDNLSDSLVKWLIIVPLTFRHTSRLSACLVDEADRLQAPLVNPNSQDGQVAWQSGYVRKIGYFGSQSQVHPFTVAQPLGFEDLLDTMRVTPRGSQD